MVSPSSDLEEPPLPPAQTPNIRLSITFFFLKNPTKAMRHLIQHHLVYGASSQPTWKLQGSADTTNMLKEKFVSLDYSMKVANLVM